MGSSRRTTTSSHSVTRSPGPQSRMRCRRHAGSGCSAAFSTRSLRTGRRRDRPGPARPPRGGGRRHRRGARVRRRGRCPGESRPAPTVRRPRSTRAPSGSAELTLSAGRRAELLEGRSRACYLADDQLEAIDVVREAIASRREEGAPAREARDLDGAQLVPLLPRAARRGAGGTRRGDSVDRRPGGEQRGGVRRVAHRSMSAWIDGDPAGGAELARRAREMALRCGDAADGGHCARRARHDRAPAATSTPAAR